MNEHPMAAELKRYRNLKRAVAEGIEMRHSAEIPTKLDQKRAAALLETMTHAHYRELWSWKGNPEIMLRKIKAGERLEFMKPHRHLNAISATFGLKWDNQREVYV